MKDNVGTLAFVYALEKIRHEEAGWAGIIIEVDQGRGWIRVQWDRPGRTLFNQDFYSEKDFLARFSWDGTGAWVVRPSR